MKISIIVPYKNSAQWIRRCLDSLVKNKGNFEFILVNDHSDDNSKEIVGSYEDERIISVNNFRKPGVGGARNTGIILALGDWISFLDSDDEAVLNLWELYSKTVENSKENINQFNHLRQYVGKTKRHLKYTNKAGLYSTKKMPLLWEFVTNKVFNRDFLEKNQILFNEEMQWGEDELFSLECVAKDNRIRCFYEANFVHHFNNKKSLAKSAGVADMYKQLDELKKFVKRQEDPEIKAFGLYWIDFHFTTDKYKQLGIKKIEKK